MASTLFSKLYFKYRGSSVWGAPTSTFSPSSSFALPPPTGEPSLASSRPSSAFPYPTLALFRAVVVERIKKVQLSESTSGARSPLRPSKRSSSTNTEGLVVPATTGHSDGSGQRCSSVEPAEINTSASGNRENWMVLSISGTKPEPRSNHAATVIGNKMIVVGGESGLGLLDDVQVLDFNQFTWSSVSSKRSLSQSSLPLKIPACKGHGLVAWGKKALLVGGKTDPVSDRISVWSFDTETECWSLMEAKGDIPIARSGHSLVRASSALILFGGEDAKRRKLNDLHMFDLKSSTWLPLHCIGTGPTPRCNHVAALYEDKMLFVFGGSSKSRTLNDLYSLDFETMIWSRVKIKGFHPSPRAGCCGVLCGTKWYITGGGSRKKRHQDTFVLDIVKMECSVAFASPPSSITINKGFSLVLVQHKEKDFLVAFGGAKKDPSNQVEVIGIENNESSDSVGERSAPTTIEPLQSEKPLGSTGLATQLGSSSHHTIESIVRQSTTTSAIDQHGSGRRKSVSESLLADPSPGSGNVSLRRQFYGEEEHSSSFRMTKKLEDGSRSSVAKENQTSPSDGPNQVTTVSKIIGEDTLKAENPDAPLPETDCPPGSVHSSIYQVYETKIAALIRKNGILEGQLAVALANQEASEKSLSVGLRSRQEMERKFAGTIREMELLKEKLSGLELAHEEASSLSNMVHSDNVRLEHDVAFLKAVLEDTQKELHSTRGVLSGERARAFQLQRLQNLKIYISLSEAIPVKKILMEKVKEMAASCKASGDIERIGVY